MRNPAGEQAELFQSLGFASLGFVALTFGDVAENQHNAGDFVFAVANRGGDLLDDVLAALRDRSVAFSGMLNRIDCASLR